MVIDDNDMKKDDWDLVIGYGKIHRWRVARGCCHEWT